MSEVKSSKELTAFGREDVEGEIDLFINSALKLPKIPTMDKKLIIEATSPGHYPGKLWEQFGISNMPPWSVEDQARSIINCVKVGAAAVHTHPRDPGAKYNHEVDFVNELELMIKVLDKVFEEVDVVTLDHAWFPKGWEGLADADFITDTKELLRIGKGNKYIEGHVMPTWISPKSRKGLLSAWFTAESMKEGIEFFEQNNIKPLISLHVDHIEWFKTNFIDTKVMKKRPHLNIQEGKHGANRSSHDPWAFLNIINSIELVRKTVPDCTIGLHTGGRNWLPLTVMGIMLGVDLVRVGIEDQFWVWPHKDEILKSPWDAVERVAQIAKALGRDIATAAEARKIMGIKRISE